VFLRFLPVIPLPRFAAWTVEDTYLEGGISQEFVDKALGTPVSDIWLPSKEELISSNAVTEVVGDDRFAMMGAQDATLTPEQRRWFVYGWHSITWKPFQAFLSLPKGDQRVLQDIIASAYEEGQTTAEMRRRASQVGSEAIRRRLLAGDDATVIQAGHIIHAAMAKLEEKDEARCAAIGAAGDMVEASIVLQEKGLDAYAMVSGLVERATAVPTIGTTPPIPSGRFVPVVERAMTCADALARYAQALSLPEADGARTIRTMLSPLRSVLASVR
jgi:hypothetical protein